MCKAKLSLMICLQNNTDSVVRTTIIESMSYDTGHCQQRKKFLLYQNRSHYNVHLHFFHWLLDNVYAENFPYWQARLPGYGIYQCRTLADSFIFCLIRFSNSCNEIRFFDAMYSLRRLPCSVRLLEYM